MNQVNFRELIKIECIETLSKIHMLYRLHYLKDTAIARFIEDTSMNALNHMINLYSQDIISYIFKNDDVMNEVLAKMRKEGKEHLSERSDAIEFFLEMC